jgi:glycosyltransferase involved in cell wall biosynthesis
MASYNGERYIAQQLDSLLSQTSNDFTLYISDDCSTDSTWEIIRTYERKFPGKIIAARNTGNSGSAKHNFISMMIEKKDDYVLLCDQDDVWLPRKIEKTILKLQRMEARYGRETPLLVHSDLTVVDENLAVITSSFREAMKVGYNRTALRHFLIQNIITGCTAAYNRALAELIMAVPGYLVMHDWWLGLIAAAFGKIEYLHEQTVLYRQHGNNEIGARDVRTLSYKVNKLLHGNEVRKAINSTYTQAASFLKMYFDILNDGQKTLLSEYISIPAKNKIMRCLTIIKLGSVKYGLERKIANFLFL